MRIKKFIVYTTDKKVCKVCGKEFFRKYTCWIKDWQQRKFCSQECAKQGLKLYQKDWEALRRPERFKYNIRKTYRSRLYDKFLKMNKYGLMNQLRRVRVIYNRVFDYLMATVDEPFKSRKKYLRKERRLNLFEEVLLDVIRLKNETGVVR